MSDSNTKWDLSTPWNRDVRGLQVLPIINADCSVMRVSAGPGTGKTFGLRRRVLRMIHPEGLAIIPNRVLICTFNRVIAKQLTEELEEELGSHDLELPEIRTVHGLAARLAEDMPRFLLPHEVETMIFDVRTANPGLSQRLGGRQSKVLRAHREHEAGLADIPALATEVRRWLTTHGCKLVGDLPREIERRIAGGDFGDRRYDRILIDEFQDLTAIESRMLIGLRSASGQIVVVGDQKQSIYAFRGNDVGGLESLDKLVSDQITDHTMDECQRCPQEIVLLANDVMARYDEPLVDLNGKVGQIHLVHHSSPTAEHRRMAEEIVRVHKAAPDARHLVLVTRRKWGYELRNAIRELDAGVTAQTVFSEDILETWPAREAFIFFTLVTNLDDSATWRDWIAYQAPDDEGKNWKAPNRNASAYRSLLEQFGVLSGDLQKSLVGQPEKIISGTGRSNVFKRLRRFSELSSDMPADLTAFELANYVFDPDRWIVESTNNRQLAFEDISRLRAEAVALAESNPESDGAGLAEQLRFRIATREPLGESEDPDIKIVTLWGAKGLTADYVFIVGLCDEALPGPHDPDSTGLEQAEHEQEQLRLLYVSLTRAKKALIVSRPTSVTRGEVASLNLLRARRGNQWRQDLGPCRFFGDVERDHLPVSEPGEKWSGIRLDPE